MNVNFATILYQIPAILIAMTVHEYAKGLASTRQGDNLPRANGKLTLNPLKHLEPIGFLFMLAFHYGWSKPTEISTAFYRDWKKGSIMTYSVAILCNVILGLACGFGYRAAALGYDRIAAQADGGVLVWLVKTGAILLLYTAKYNIYLGLSNLLPAPPMAGAKLLSVFLSANNRIRFTSYEKIFQLVMVLLLVSGVLGMALDPIGKAILGF